MCVIVGTLLLVLAGATQAAQAPSAPRKVAQPKSCNCTVTLPPATPDARGTAESPLSVRVVQLPPAPEPRMDRSGRVVAAATVFLAVFTLALAAATVRMVTRRGMDRNADRIQALTLIRCHPR